VRGPLFHVGKQQVETYTYIYSFLYTTHWIFVASDHMGWLKRPPVLPPAVLYHPGRNYSIVFVLRLKHSHGAQWRM
jgi:hypothetical protein